MHCFQTGKVVNTTQKNLLELEFFVRLCDLDKSDWVVDLTCGSGSGCIAGLRMGHSVAGIDLSEKQVEATSFRMQQYAAFEVN